MHHRGLGRKRRLPLARYSSGPNALSKFLLVMLRIAIGWHVAYEGLCKLDPNWASLMRQPPEKESKAAEQFTAEGYLRASTGPLRRQFRSMIPDYDGLRKLELDKLEADWRAYIQSAFDYYRMTEGQRNALEAERKRLLESATSYLNGDKTKTKIEQYKKSLESWDEEDRKDWYGSDRSLRQEWTKLESTRRELTAPIIGYTKELETAVAMQLTSDQAALPPPNATVKDFQNLPKLEQANFITKWGLTICGICMIVGFFSQLSSLGTACFLALFYFSLPPWPGLPPVPGTEGNYLIVNKNLVEMIACLALATMPTGAWGGLDAFFRGLITRPLLGIGAREVIERQRAQEEEDDD